MAGWPNELSNLVGVCIHMNPARPSKADLAKEKAILRRLLRQLLGRPPTEDELEAAIYK